MTRLVIHADDVGMCHGANEAFVELSHHGSISAGSVMVPCPWFPEIAELAAADPVLDVGVHLTLNSEMDFYRWGPISAATPASGLTDPDGYMWRRVHEVRSNANPEAVEVEWRAQIDRALAAGIDVTHLDVHMGSGMAPEWCDRYIRVAADYDVPALITATLDAYGPKNHLAGVAESEFEPFVAEAQRTGMPIFDLVLETDFSRGRGVPNRYESMLGGNLPALVFCAFHPSVAGPGEIEVIEPSTSHVRTEEHELFRSDDWKQWLDTQSFTLTSMRELRDEFRNSPGAGRGGTMSDQLALAVEPSGQGSVQRQR